MAAPTKHSGGWKSPQKLLNVRRLYIKEAASYSLGTAVGLGQPPPFIQHLHQTHDCHLAVSAADHVQETLRGGSNLTHYCLTKVQHTSR